jgi:hypothetical protein
MQELTEAASLLAGYENVYAGTFAGTARDIGNIQTISK